MNTQNPNWVPAALTVSPPSSGSYNIYFTAQSIQGYLNTAIDNIDFQLGACGGDPRKFQFNHINDEVYRKKDVSDQIVYTTLDSCYPCSSDTVESITGKPSNYKLKFLHKANFLT